MLDVLHHLALPSITLAIIFLAQYARLSRASMIEVLGADYVRTARAKGVAEMRVIFWHALRNAILPLLTGLLAGGAPTLAVGAASAALSALLFAMVLVTLFSPSIWAGSSNEFQLHARWRPIPRSSFVTSRSRRLMWPFKPKF